MYYSSEMEWNPKRGWENLDMFNSEGSESLKKLQLTDWEVEEEGESDTGSYKMSGSRCGSGSGGSDSELVHGYSVRSSISASTESCPYEVMKASHFVHEAYVSTPGTMIKSEIEQYMVDASGMENSFVTAEPLLGLKLGKRTYFENNSNINSPASLIPAVGKKTKASFLNGVIPRCQVQSCNLDLSSAKEYHRKHRVCDTHSKSPRLIVGGMELRFCQQCSRFHSLSDFDEKKRSCRRRLSDHNARRRKPKQETLQFHSTKLSAPLYDGMQQMNFTMDSNAGGSNLENLYSSKFTVDKSFPWRFEKAGQQPSMQNVGLPRVKFVRSNSTTLLSANNGNPTHVFTQGKIDLYLVKYYSSEIQSKKTEANEVTGRCKVPGCNNDPSLGRKYHLKRNVCEFHSKSRVVFFEGREQRYCQKCSRFENLCEFDGVFKTCRKKLQERKARRRKSKQEKEKTEASFQNGDSSDKETKKTKASRQKVQSLKAKQQETPQFQSTNLTALYVKISANFASGMSRAMNSKIVMAARNTKIGRILEDKLVSSRELFIEVEMIRHDFQTSKSKVGLRMGWILGLGIWWLWNKRVGSNRNNKLKQLTEKMPKMEEKMDEMKKGEIDTNENLGRRVDILTNDVVKLKQVTEKMPKMEEKMEEMKKEVVDTNENFGRRVDVLTNDVAKMKHYMCMKPVKRFAQSPISVARDEFRLQERQFSLRRFY